MTVGNIADSSTQDTPSANPWAVYPLQAHGGSDKTYQTVWSGGGRIVGIDPVSDPTDVTGIPTGLPPGPTPATLPRTPPIVGIVNSAIRGVYFEGTLVPVIGDGVIGIGAVPTPRLLTTPGKYGSILIGTRT